MTEFLAEGSACCNQPLIGDKDGKTVCSRCGRRQFECRDCGMLSYLEPGQKEPACCRKAAGRKM